MVDPTRDDDGASTSEVPPELPGSGTPPIEGRQWVQVKIGVWAVAAVLALAVAWIVASLLAG